MDERYGPFTHESLARLKGAHLHGGVQPSQPGQERVQVVAPQSSQLCRRWGEDTAQFIGLPDLKRPVQQFVGGQQASSGSSYV